MRILVADPDQIAAASIELMLRNEGFNVYATDLAEEAIDCGKLYDYDAIVTEVFGFNVVKRLREAKVTTPILVLSGLAGLSDIVRALDAGADDYMPKPFHKDELVARICAIIRRSKGHPASIIETGNVAVNISTKTVSVGGQSIHLTSKEYGILELLSLRKGSTISKEMLLNHLYGGMDEPEIKIIDVFVCKIRKKLRAYNGHDIETVWGRGYVLRDAATPTVASPSLAPAMRDMLDASVEKGPGLVTTSTFNEVRQRAIRDGKIKSPSLVPASGQR